MSSVRIANGSLTKGSVAHDINTEGTLSGSHVYGQESYADGANLKYYGQITRRVSIFPRSNSSDSFLVGGKPLIEKFDDTLSPTSSRQQKFSKYTTWGQLYNAWSFPQSSRIDHTVQYLTNIPPGQPGGGRFFHSGTINTSTKIYISPPYETDEQPAGNLVFDVVQDLPEEYWHVVKVRYNPILSTITFVKDFSSDNPYDVGILYTNKSQFQIDKDRKITQIINHEVEKRDLGYSEIYNDNKPFKEAVEPDNPVPIIELNPEDIYLPLSMVSPANELTMNGVIEPFRIRSEMDWSKSEIPFSTKGIRGSVGYDEDAYRKSVIIFDGYNEGDSDVVPFLDAVEYFWGVELPPVFHLDETTVQKFRDTNNERELYFEKKAKKGITISEDIKNVLLKSSFDTSDSDPFDYSGAKGTSYIGGGTDSLIYGGLKK